MHVRFIPSVHEQHADDCDVGKDKEGRNEQNGVDSCSEIVGLEMSGLPASYKDLHHQGKAQEQI